MKRIIISLFASMSVYAAFAIGWPSAYSGVMLQAFYWDSYSDSKWPTLETQASELSRFFDLVWIPQSGKTSTSTSMGYNPLYWFPGEENYTSSFGTEAELRSMITTFKSAGMGTIADVVLNHRANVSTWVDFPSETYNGVTYQLKSTDICADDDDGSTKTWATTNGYSLSSNNDTGEDWSGARDLDHYSSNVQTNAKAYLKMLLNDFGYAGFRYDMVKGYSGSFTKIYNNYVSPTYCVGEYWDSESAIESWISATGNTSAAFDFQNRYLVRNALRGSTDDNAKTWSDVSNWTYNWSLLSGSDVLCKKDSYKQYAVTFVENHDTEYRSYYSQNDPIRKDTLAANAYIIGMPGTPCVFLKHWQDCKKEISRMIKIRKAVGITNTSSSSNIRSSSSYFIQETHGTNNSKSLIFILGDLSAALSSYNPVTYGFTKALSGYHYAYYTYGVSANTATYFVDKYTGTYDNSVKVTISPVGGTVVFTRDGTTPTKSNGIQITSDMTVTFSKTSTLKVGILNGSTVEDISTYTYTIAAFQPYDIDVYVCVDSVSSWDQTAVNYWTWYDGSNTTGGYDSDHKQGYTTWPGRSVTTTTIIDGRTWFKNTYTINGSDDYVSFVFSTSKLNGTSKSPSSGNGSQTVDVTKVTQTSYFEVSASTNSSGNHPVNDLTETLSVEKITDKASPSVNNAWYDISGREIRGGDSPTTLPKGLYIHNRNKVVIK